MAGLTADEARELLLKQIEGTRGATPPTWSSGSRPRRAKRPPTRAQQIITEAIQRSAAEHAIETTVSVVDLPSDDLKGRIIGREGRNIRALEIATGVELIVDDTPGADHPLGLRPLPPRDRAQAIERLIADGRIHPARIEEVVEKVKAEIEETVRKEGEAAAFELGLHDLHPEVLRLMGRLKFRTSYGQNVLTHSKEVAFLAGIMAHGARARRARHGPRGVPARHRQGDRPRDAGHAPRDRRRLPPQARRERAGHHRHRRRAPHGHRLAVLEAMLVQAADAISAARPGARRDILESYVKRLEKLEGIADSFKGVSKSFALQAGREIRIMVESERITDEEAVWLSKDIARRIESELEYPGPDQGHGHPRDAGRRVREVDVPAPTVGEIGEREVIRRVRRRLPAAPGWLTVGIGDDAAVARPARNRDEVLTTDALVEGVHFDRAYVPPEAIGAKALAVNLSDLAAMGAEPRLALLSLILPADTTR